MNASLVSSNATADASMAVEISSVSPNHIERFVCKFRAALALTNAIRDA
ncbi:MAG TPA: hypothetical protein VI565_07860 [Burkholderiales bacterium]|nr:hypothetical protein [Burkholderiales bacterium]